MRLGIVVEKLCQVFPSATTETRQLRNMRKAKTDKKASGGYDYLHNDIIIPLAQIHRLMHTVSLAVSQSYNAYG